jgi:peroxiredoxin
MLLDTPLCDFGWKAPDFTLQDAYGKSYTMRDHLGDRGLLIMFICNHCPYVHRIVEHLVEDTQLLLAEGINVLAIMSNDYTEYAEDSPENMKLFAQEHNFSFPYLVDKDQSVGKSYDAVCTPDFFGLNARGELQYRGRLDDTTRDNDSNRTAELLNAMRTIAKTGRGPKEQIASMGCSIKWREEMSEC